ncbi:MAG: hypothetical protein J6M65_04375 [Eubacterium sp.]|nr:hypothetical protein [Eubacterium sp.]
MKDLFKIYDKYIEPYEDEDDRHRKKLNKSYNEYTSIKNKIKNSVSFYIRIRNTLQRHMYIAMSVAVAIALFPEAVTVVAIAAVAAGIAISAIPDKYFGNKVLKRIKASTDEKVKIVKQGPAKVVKVIVNDVADTVQTPEGIAGFVGDVIGAYAGGKIAKAIKISYNKTPQNVDTEISVEGTKKTVETKTNQVDKLKNTESSEKVKSQIESKTPEVDKTVNSEGGRYSGVLEKVNKPDPAADALAERIGGKSRVKFSTDTTGREFDVVNDEYIAQAKPSLNSYGKSWRNQTKATFEAAKATGRKAYFQFEGTPK